MRMSKLFSQTLREAPSEAEVIGHRLLARAGFIRPLASGVFSVLPLGQRTLTKIENILREEMNAIGGQEITMPVVHPAELWQESGRWYKVGAELGRFKDRSGRDMVLAMTHEEVVADLVRKEIRSYRQLPALIYHIQTKWRDEPRPRAGLIRVREFTMKDSYSLDADLEGLDRQYRAHYQAYFNIFHRCGLPVMAVEADVGIMGGSLAHEFMYLNPIGEDTLLICDNCGYAANRQIARFRKPVSKDEPLAPLEKVATPEVKTIEALAQFLNVPKARTAKAVFLVATLADGRELFERLVFAVVRGDMEVNETKLAQAIRARELRPAREDEIAAIGAVPGYASPIGLKDVLVVVDESVQASPNLVAGANEAGFHLRNVNYGRDYQAQVVADITAAEEGSLCPQCGTPMRAVRGVEVGNIFKLGTFYSESMGATYLDQQGKSKPVIMGSYGIGSGRLMACVAEEYNDERGLVWPVTIAPYLAHLVALGRQSGDDSYRIAEGLYADLEQAGIETLFDDREESPGIKFNDADLIGLPVRLTVSDRSLKAGGVEYKRRDGEEKQVIPLEQVVAHIQGELQAMHAAIAKTVTEMPYPV